MALYVRISCGYWSHRKTLRLSALLGPQYAYIPVRLWCYAAENQPDGNFSKYLPEELAMLLGYSGNACGMLEALQQAGFLDGMSIHDWHDHNSYHEKFAERARKAAHARWEKEGQDKKGKETSNACSISTEKKDVFPTTERSKTIASLFGRRETTAWDEKEIKAFRATQKHPDEDFNLVIEFYQKSNSPFLRKDLGTFLNNFTGELDRARKWKSSAKGVSNGVITAAEALKRQQQMDAEQERKANAH